MRAYPTRHTGCVMMNTHLIVHAYIYCVLAFIYIQNLCSPIHYITPRTPSHPWRPRTMINWKHAYIHRHAHVNKPLAPSAFIFTPHRPHKPAFFDPQYIRSLNTPPTASRPYKGHSLFKPWSFQKLPKLLQSRSLGKVLVLRESAEYAIAAILPMHRLQREIWRPGTRGPASIQASTCAVQFWKKFARNPQLKSYSVTACCDVHIVRKSRHTNTNGIRVTFIVCLYYLLSRLQSASFSLF